MRYFRTGQIEIVLSLCSFELRYIYVKSILACGGGCITSMWQHNLRELIGFSDFLLVESSSHDEKTSIANFCGILAILIGVPPNFGGSNQKNH